MSEKKVHALNIQEYSKLSTRRRVSIGGVTCFDEETRRPQERRRSVTEAYSYFLGRRRSSNEEKHPVAPLKPILRPSKIVGNQGNRPRAFKSRSPHKEEKDDEILPTNGINGRFSYKLDNEENEPKVAFGSPATGIRRTFRRKSFYDNGNNAEEEVPDNKTFGMNDIKPLYNKSHYKAFDTRKHRRRRSMESPPRYGQDPPRDASPIPLIQGQEFSSRKARRSKHKETKCGERKHKERKHEELKEKAVLEPPGTIFSPAPVYPHHSSGIRSRLQEMKGNVVEDRDPLLREQRSFSRPRRRSSMETLSKEAKVALHGESFPTPPRKDSRHFFACSRHSTPSNINTLYSELNGLSFKNQQQRRGTASNSKFHITIQSKQAMKEKLLRNSNSTTTTVDEDDFDVSFEDLAPPAPIYWNE